jgi:DNA-binding NtrC family response regulator
MVTVPEPLVIVAANEPATVQEVAPLLREWGCRVMAVASARHLIDGLATETPALLLLEPGFVADGGEGLSVDHPGLPVALLAGRDSCRAGETAVRSGAFDYLTWPLDPHRLRVVVAHALERFRLLERIRRLESFSRFGIDEEDGHLRAIDRMEKGAILDALRRSGGNVREAARLLGFGQATVYRKIKRYRIELAGRLRAADGSAPVTLHPQDPAQSFGSAHS